MVAPREKNGLETGPKNELTVMFFFASDRDLSPSMISQIKAIKDAGFQKNTSVLIHFDPNERGAGTRMFEVNRLQKEEMGSIIGDGKDPFVRNLKDDTIDGAPINATAADALKTFLDIALENHTAKHYLLFLVGHGTIVGNDAFLPDRRPETAISLEELGDLLWDFSLGAKLRGGVFELVGMHSCSMSAIEVVYQLKGTARYMMATEGVSFVSSWPYRQLVKKILNTADEAERAGAHVDVDELVRKIHSLTLHNYTDFMFSGKSADLCVSRLDTEVVEKLNQPLQDLVKALKNALQVGQRRGIELILLAHLKAQSYFQEAYTDLYDFCLCLERECSNENKVEQAMKSACKSIREILDESSKPTCLITRSDHFGPMYQYSHGLSIYFPWSRPIEDTFNDVLGRYGRYEFTKELGGDSWLSFLEAYFVATRRDPREKEDQPSVVAINKGSKTNGFAAAATIGAVGTIGTIGRNFGESLPGGDEKVTPELTEGSCGCQSIKNYPMEFSMSPRTKMDPNSEETENGRGRPTKAASTRGWRSAKVKAARR